MSAEALEIYPAPCYGLMVYPQENFKEWIKSTLIKLKQIPKDLDKIPESSFLDTGVLIALPAKKTDTPASITALIKDNHEQLFRSILDYWCPYDKLWPETLDFDTFIDWFKVELHSHVFSLE